MDLLDRLNNLMIKNIEHIIPLSTLLLAFVILIIGWCVLIKG